MTRTYNLRSCARALATTGADAGLLPALVIGLLTLLLSTSTEPVIPALTLEFDLPDDSPAWSPPQKHHPITRLHTYGLKRKRQVAFDGLVQP